jgi:superfamily II DNA helicase RecQ
LPKSLEELRNISGIGATKLERYGAMLLEVVRHSGGGVGDSDATAGGGGLA